MSAQTGSSFIALDIPTEHPTIIDFPLVEEFPSNLSVSQSLKIEASGSEDNFILGFVKEYDSGSLNLQIESKSNVNSGSFSGCFLDGGGPIFPRFPLVLGGSNS